MNARMFRANGKFGFVDENGHIVIEPRFDDAHLHYRGDPYHVHLNNKVGLVSQKGRIVVEPQFDSIGEFCCNGLSRVSLNEKWGYIDRQGKVAINFDFDSADDFNENGLAKVQVNGKYGLINTLAQFVIKPEYDYFSDLAHKNVDGWRLVRKGDKWSCINSEGREQTTGLDHCYGSFYRDGWTECSAAPLFGVGRPFARKFRR